MLLIYSFAPAPASIPIGNILNSLGIFCSVTTTVSATSLIACKIVLVTRRSRMVYSYNKILEILVQSAALVSIFLSAIAILQLFAPNVDHITPHQRLMYNISIYMKYSLGAIIVRASSRFNYNELIRTLNKGISPTLISFRVLENSSEPVSNTTRQTALSRLASKRSTHNSHGRNQQTRHSIIHMGCMDGVEQFSCVQSTMDSGHEKNIPVENVKAVENQN